LSYLITQENACLLYYITLQSIHTYSNPDPANTNPSPLSSNCELWPALALLALPAATNDAVETRLVVRLSAANFVPKCVKEYTVARAADLPDVGVGRSVLAVSALVIATVRVCVAVGPVPLLPLFAIGVDANAEK